MKDKVNRGIHEKMAPRRFYLKRVEDPTGVSGTGIVATGVEFPDGPVVVRWDSATPTTVIFESMTDVQLVHGHGGATQILFVDGEYTVLNPEV